MLFFFGIIAGLSKDTYFLMNYMTTLREGISTIVNINPHGLLQIFLPILVFEAGFSLDWHIFRKELSQIMLLAFPCVLINALIMMVCVKFVLQYEDDYYTWTGAWMFGSIVSCTDPIAVVALLKELGASKKFNSIIEGESLFNDAVGMILYQIGTAIYKGSTNPLSIAIMFISLTGGGLVLGVLIGAIAAYFIKRMFNDDMLVVNITFICGFIAFFIAESYLTEEKGIMVSGIMTLVCLGCFMAAFGKSRISPETEEAVHSFWHFLVYAAETIIFFLAGAIVGGKVIKDEMGYIRYIDYIKLIFIYIFMNIARFISLSIFYKFIVSWGYGLTGKEFFVLCYGGLRGAVGISFAMIAANNFELPPCLRDIFLFDMAGCAVLTLLINSPTCGIIIDYLGILNEKTIKIKVFSQFIEGFVEKSDDQVAELKAHRYLQLANWDMVKNYAGFDEFGKYVQELNHQVLQDESVQPSKETEMNLLPTSEHYQIETQLINKYDPLIIETRSRYLTCLKGLYSELYEQHQITGDTLLLLQESASWDIDNVREKLNSWQMIYYSFYGKSRIKYWFDKKDIPIVGGIIKSNLFSHLAHQYDVVSAYIDAHEKAEEVSKEFQLDQNFVKIIREESIENKLKAQEYLYTFLDSSFPEISRLLQTKKASQNILEYQKHHLNECFAHGQLEEKEYSKMKEMIFSNILRVEKMEPNWEPVSLKEYFQSIPFFQYITEMQLDKLLSESTERTFSQGDVMTQQGNKAEYIYVIIRGGITEQVEYSYPSYTSLAGAGTICTLHQIILSQNSYLSTITASCQVIARQFPLSCFHKLLSQTPDLELFIWRECLFAFQKIYSSEFGELSALSRDSMLELSAQSIFRRYSPLQIIDFTAGGIFLQGVAKIYCPEKMQALIENSQGKDKDEQNKVILQLQAMEAQRNFTKICYIPPQPSQTQQFLLVALNDVVALHFNVVDDFYEILDKDKNQKIKYSFIGERSSFRKSKAGQQQQQSLQLPEITVNKLSLIHI
eukprot:TRINITY_DN4237_c0_g2_i3.p1 TRINITY_DN4237_c0_g2~~TRINITY_DN4237_c0_g2_i3.p1  ORF type:complete len:1010 (-),score=126.86 TRINITY_DN4237_c0_g2_i3:14-3043(-)